MKFTSLSFVVVVALILSSCSLFGGNPATTANNQTLLDVSVLGLGIQVLNPEPLGSVGQTINIGYVVSNTGGSPLTGPVTVLDTQGTVTCPEVNTVGNLDGNLDPAENITCTSSHVIAQADIDAGAITRTATATAGGISSSQVTVSINVTPVRTLALSVTASPTSYSQLGQTITYTYIIKNSGSAILGPGQFTITDDRIGGQFNCGGNATTIAPNETLTCGATYIIAQGDLSANDIKNNATASGAGAGPSQTTTATVTNTNVVTGNPSNLPPGTTIQHTVVDGEWLLQIARCYGADYKEVRNANPQITNPAYISPGMVVSVPRIGSAGKIYGKPCITQHTVQNGDTWESIAQKYNADVAVLKMANPDGIGTGRVLKIPLNSAGSTPVVVSSNPVAPAPTTAPAESEPIRINLPAGSDSVTLTGIIPAQGSARYTIHVNQNSILGVNVSAPANEVAMLIRLQGGDTVKPSDTTLSWSGTITQNGDYIIRLDAIAGNANKSFILDISVTPAEGS